MTRLNFQTYTFPCLALSVSSHVKRFSVTLFFCCADMLHRRAREVVFGVCSLLHKVATEQKKKKNQQKNSLLKVTSYSFTPRCTSSMRIARSSKESEEIGSIHYSERARIDCNFHSVAIIYIITKFVFTTIEELEAPRWTLWQTSSHEIEHCTYMSEERIELLFAGLCALCVLNKWGQMEWFGLANRRGKN